MPIVGNLSEFPLPEVLLLIGQRTGRLRLLDVPEYGILDLDISNGTVQTMHLGASLISETQTMLDKLGSIVQSQRGMFEFSLVPVSMVAHLQAALTVHDLAMKLVCYVDEQAANQLLTLTAQERHKLVLPPPEIWVEAELDQFLQAAHPYLTNGVLADELAVRLEMDKETVRKNLTHLRLLGLVDVIEGIKPMAPMLSEQASTKSHEIRKTSRAFSSVLRARERVQKLSS